MKKLKLNANNILVCMFEVIIGILILIDPVAFTSGIIIACGVVLMLLGFASIIKYFRMDVEDAAISQKLLKGLILLVTGAFCVLNSQWFITTFPLLTMVYGVVILVTGLGKIQWAVDMLRMKRVKWFFPAISAIVSIICAIVILNNPFASTTVLWIFTGIALIVDAMFDAVTLAVGGRERETTAAKQEETTTGSDAVVSEAAPEPIVEQPEASEEKTE